MNIRSLAAVIALLVILVGVAFAEQCPQGNELKIWGGLDSKPKVVEGYAPEKVEIGVGSYKLLDLYGGAAGYTLAEREVAVYNRLTESLSIGPVSPDMICVGKVRSAPTVYVGPVRFISAYASDAEAAGMTQQELAETWADTLTAVLPRMTTATADKITGPPGVVKGTYEVAVGGILLFRLRGPDGAKSLQERGKWAEDHIVLMLSDGKAKPAVAKATQMGGEWVVTLGSEAVVTATTEDAAANHTTTELLAEAWAAKLNAQLPKLKGPTGVGNIQ